MNCDEVEELIGAYVLDALPEAAAAAVREHLAGCPEQAEAVADLRRVAVRLPALADSVAPSLELRYRVLGAIARDAQQHQRAPMPSPEARTPLDISNAPSAQRSRSRARWLSASWRGWAAVAAVLVIAVAGLLVWNVVLLNRDDAGSAQKLASHVTSVTTLQPAGGARTSGSVLYFADEKKAAVFFSTGLALPQTYQLWQIPPDGTPRSLGVRDGAAGVVSMVVPYDPSASGTIAVTIEPPGGSPQPTSSPILSAEI